MYEKQFYNETSKQTIETIKKYEQSTHKRNAKNNLLHTSK